MDLFSLNADHNIDWVIETYKSTVYGIALTRTKSCHDADDIFQDVFLAYYRKRPKFNEEEHRKAWLIKTTINCTKKVINKKQRNLVEMIEEVSTRLDLFQSEEDITNFMSLYTSLCELPERYRIVLYLYYFEDLSVDQISKLLHVRSGTIRMQMTRGREHLRKNLEGEFL